MKKLLLAKLLICSIFASGYIYANTQDLSESDTRGVFDFLSGKKSEIAAAPAQTSEVDTKITPENSLLIEDLDNPALKCGDWDEWGCCPKRRIKAYEVCAREIYTNNLCAHHAKIKELCAHKAKIEKLWSDLIATDVLFAEKARIDKLWAGQACAYLLCAQKGHIDALLSDLIYTDSLHADQADLDKVSSDAIASKKLCACEAHFKKMCADDAVIKDLKAIGQLEFQGIYRAFVYDAAASQPYTLGADIKFDTIADDPNGNITQGAATTYTAPVSGGYILSLGITAQELNGPNPISGQPVNHPEIWINGVHKTQTHLGFLSFSDSQNCLLTTLIHLNKGDVLTCKYNIKFINPVTGEQNYPGTINLLGQAPLYSQDTFMAIHYLSSDKIEYTPCEEGSCFDVERPCIPPCCPCPMQKPDCEVDCHLHAQPHGHGGCNDHGCHIDDGHNHDCDWDDDFDNHPGGPVQPVPPVQP